VTLRNPILGAALALLLAACASQQSPAQRVESIERAAMTPLKTQYPDVIMGFDFHGTSVDVSVDINAMDQMDDDKEDAMRAAALRDWRNAWLQAHPHGHAKLTMRIINFRGVQESKREINA
jgi:hypothetical protein